MAYMLKHSDGDWSFRFPHPKSELLQRKYHLSPQQFDTLYFIIQNYPICTKEMFERRGITSTTDQAIEYGRVRRLVKQNLLRRYQYSIYPTTYAYELLDALHHRHPETKPADYAPRQNLAQLKAIEPDLYKYHSGLATSRFER